METVVADLVDHHESFYNDEADRQTLHLDNNPYIEMVQQQEGEHDEQSHQAKLTSSPVRNDSLCDPPLIQLKR